MKLKKRKGLELRKEKREKGVRNREREREKKKFCPNTISYSPNYISSSPKYYYTLLSISKHCVNYAKFGNDER